MNPTLRAFLSTDRLCAKRSRGLLPVMRSAAGLIGAFLLFCAPITPVSAASIFGIHGGAALWNPDFNGTVGQSTNGFDLNGEFSESSADSSTVYVAVEHFVPFIPNAMVKLTPLSGEARSDNASGTLGGLITLQGEVDAELDLDMADLTLYYELLDNWVTLDLGLTARTLDGFMSATEVNTNTSDRVNVDAVIPMLYGHARFDLPFSGLAAGLRGNIIGYQGNNLSDLEAYLHLEVDLIPLFDFGIMGGVRRLTLDIDDLDDWNSDATIEGAFIGLTASF